MPHYSVCLIRAKAYTTVLLWSSGIADLASAVFTFSFETSHHIAHLNCYLCLVCLCHCIWWSWPKKTLLCSHSALLTLHLFPSAWSLPLKVREASYLISTNLSYRSDSPPILQRSTKPPLFPATLKMARLPSSQMGKWWAAWEPANEMACILKAGVRPDASQILTGTALYMMCLLIEALEQQVLENSSINHVSLLYTLLLAVLLAC